MAATDHNHVLNVNERRDHTFQAVLVVRVLCRHAALGSVLLYAPISDRIVRRHSAVSESAVDVATFVSGIGCRMFACRRLHNRIARRQHCLIPIRWHSNRTGASREPSASCA